MNRAKEATLEVSHESVLRHWRTLNGWIEDERANLVALDAVRAAAVERHRRLTAENASDREAWLVHRGERLAQVEGLLHRVDYVHLLGEEGRAYLQACRAREDAERVEARARLRREQDQVARQRRLQQRAGVALGLRDGLSSRRQGVGRFSEGLGGRMQARGTAEQTIA